MRAGLKNRRAMGDGDGDGMAWPRSAPWAVAVLSFSSDGMAMACRCSTAQRALQWQREQQGHQHGPSWQQPLIIMLIIAVGGGGREELASAPPSFLIKIVGATNERGKIRRPPPPTAMINIIISGLLSLESATPPPLPSSPTPLPPSMPCEAAQERGHGPEPRAGWPFKAVHGGSS